MWRWPGKVERPESSAAGFEARRKGDSDADVRGRGVKVEGPRRRRTKGGGVVCEGEVDVSCRVGRHTEAVTWSEVLCSDADACCLFLLTILFLGCLGCNSCVTIICYMFSSLGGDGVSWLYPFFQAFNRGRVAAGGGRVHGAPRFESSLRLALT